MRLRGNVNQPHQSEIIVDRQDKTSSLGACFRNSNSRRFGFSLDLPGCWSAAAAVVRLLLLMLMMTALDDVFYCGVAASPPSIQAVANGSWTMTDGRHLHTF